MTDIIYGEKLKKIFRMILKLGYMKLKKDMQMVGEDLKHTGNPVVKNLNTLLIISSNHLKQPDEWQKRMILGYGQGILWAASKDTAYRDFLFWTIDKFVDSVIKNPEKWKEMLKPYVKPPEEWIPNLWTDSKNKTEKLRKQGKIAKFAKSYEESLYTPDIQEKRHESILKKIKK